MAAAALEAAQAERECRRDCLAVASVDRLNQPAVTGASEIFRGHARCRLHCLRDPYGSTQLPSHPATNFLTCINKLVHYTYR